ncbi:MAG: NifU family protein [Candidatus Hydrogenedentota bacterium]
MPKWFKKVFSSGVAKPQSSGAPDASTQTLSEPTAVATPPSLDHPALGQPDTSQFEQDAPKVRKVLNAPVVMAEEEQSSWSEDIKIKARVDADSTTCVFMVDRPVLENLSAWFPGAQWADGASPFSTKLFEVDGVGTVLLHDFTVSISMTDDTQKQWGDLAPEIGTVIRVYLKSEDDPITSEFRDSIPPSEEIRRKVQSCIDLEINPGIASHSGVVTLERVVGNTVFLTMGGGCQGCAASAITLRQGIHTTFRNAVPQLGGIFDETDHTAGTNPFYSELPPGMN